MSEHTPLTEDVNLLLAKYAGRSKWVGYEKARREAWAEIEDDLRRLAARTSTATADAGLRDLCWAANCDRPGSIKSERYGGYLCPHHAMHGPDATAAPTADTEARE